MRAWLAYALLALARVWLAVNSYGYVHPDEVFQSPHPAVWAIERQEYFKQQNRTQSTLQRGERLNALQFLQNGLPWEFTTRTTKEKDRQSESDSDHDVSLLGRFLSKSRVGPCRSVAVVGLSWLPLQFRRFLVSYMAGTNGDSSAIFGEPRVSILEQSAAIVAAPRVFMTLLSFALDVALVLVLHLINRRMQAFTIATSVLTGKNSEGDDVTGTPAQNTITSASNVPVPSSLYSQRPSQRRIEQISIASALLRLAVCWPVLVLHTRTFSNAAEGILAAVVAALAIAFFGDSPMERRSILSFRTVFASVLIGLTIGTGIFVRFTFVAFAFPWVLFIASTVFTTSFMICMGKGSLLLRTVASLCGPIIVGLAAAFGVAVASAAFIFADSSFFGLLDVTVFLSAHWDDIPSILADNLTVTPLNNMLYNLDAENLAEHGIHWRGLHAFVNLPMLFGPLLLFIMLSMISKRLEPELATDDSETLTWARAGEYDNAKQISARAKGKLGLWCVFAVAFPILILGSAPHQEPRFLLPLLFPLALLAALVDRSRGQGIASEMEALSTASLLFNFSLVLFFGILHQGGVTQAAMALADSPSLCLDASSAAMEADSSTAWHGVNVVFFHTYSAPTYLLHDRMLSSSGHHEDCFVHEVHDLSGAVLSELQELIRALRKRSPANVGTLVVAPSTVPLTLDQMTARHMAAFGPHLSMENPPDWMRLISSMSDIGREQETVEESSEASMYLAVYAITKS